MQLSIVGGGMIGGGMIGQSKAERESEELSKRNAAEAHAGLRDIIEELHAENAQLKKALEILAQRSQEESSECLGDETCPVMIDRTDKDCIKCYVTWAMSEAKK